MTKKVPTICHDLKDHDSQLIMQEIGKFDVKINVIQNVMNSNLDSLVNNLQRIILRIYHENLLVNNSNE